jgi:hypothetical protein
MPNQYKHTPGPWFHALQAGAETQHFIYGPQGKPRIAEVLGNSTDQINANARLLLEAPVMLELLESLTFIAETVAHTRGLERDILPTTDKARELIARVKG